MDIQTGRLYMELRSFCTQPVSQKQLASFFTSQSTRKKNTQPAIWPLAIEVPTRPTSPTSPTCPTCPFRHPAHTRTCASALRPSDFGFRISAFFRPSDFTNMPPSAAICT